MARLIAADRRANAAGSATTSHGAPASIIVATSGTAILIRAPGAFTPM